MTAESGPSCPVKRWDLYHKGHYMGNHRPVTWPPQWGIKRIVLAGRERGFSSLCEQQPLCCPWTKMSSSLVWLAQLVCCLRHLARGPHHLPWVNEGSYFSRQKAEISYWNLDLFCQAQLMSWPIFDLEYWKLGWAGAMENDDYVRKAMIWSWYWNHQL